MGKYLQTGLLVVSPLLLTGCALVDRSYEERPRIAQRPTPTPAPTAIPEPTQTAGPPAPLLKQAPVVPSLKRPNPNGYDLLVRAAGSIKPELAPEYDLVSQKAAAKKNAPGLEMVRQAFKLPIVAPLQRGTPTVNFHYSKLRMLTRAIMQDAQVQAAEGNIGAAVQRGLDAVQMGVAMQNGGSHMAMLVGVAIEAMARRDLWKWHELLSASQAAQAARRLETIEARRPSYVAIVTEAKWETLSFLRLMFRGADWKKARMFKDPADRSRLQGTSDRQIEANLVAAMDASIARAKMPYSRNLPAVLKPADPLSAMLTATETSSIRTRLVYEHHRADSRLLLSALVLQAHAKASGQPPQALSELVPKYLRAVPRDPFAPASPLRYKRSGSSFTLYSVGPDGVDGGGAPLEGRGITFDSRGDMVGGLPPVAPSATDSSFRTIVPTSERESQTWKYTFTAPPSAWQQKDFDDSKWRTGRGGFGRFGTPNIGKVGTLWTTSDVWMRRTFNPGRLTTAQIAKIGVRYYHDEAVEVYINGTQVYSEGGFSRGYERRPLDFVARRVIIPNAKNVLAVHCHQTKGGQYIDVGLEEVISRR